MQSNIPRAAIHVGKDKKSFSAQVGNEAERRGWDENDFLSVPTWMAARGMFLSIRISFELVT